MTMKLLRALPPRAIVFGVTTEYCVRLACLGLRDAGIKTALVTDAVCALTPEGGRAALEEMKSRGVELVALETVLGV